MEFRKTIVVLMLLGGYAHVNAQEVIASQGETLSNGTNSIDYTIGEVVINTVSNGTNDLTQGFHQTNWSFVGVDDLAPELTISVYPNPMMESLTIKATASEINNYVFYDAKGRVVQQGSIESETTVLDVQGVAPGSYSLAVLVNHKLAKTFKLVKHN